MNTWLIVSCAVCIFWNLAIVSVETPSGRTIRGWRTSNIVQQFSSLYSIPPSLCQLWEHQGHLKIPVDVLTRGRHSISARPVSGDHIHMAMSIWIGDSARPPEHDRPYEEDIPYETFPKTCHHNGSVAYTKLWPHAGVHTHCDGLIHVHPWSSPRSIRKEGRQVTLGLWFDQVGIEYTRAGLQFRDTGPLDNNATHKWRLAEYVCVHDATYTVYESQLDRVWLGHAYGAYVLWFGASTTPPPMIQEHVSTLTRWGAVGFDGQPYPQTCI